MSQRPKALFQNFLMSSKTPSPQTIEKITKYAQYGKVFLAKPSDRTIRIISGIYSLGFIALIVLTTADYSLYLPQVSAEIASNIEYTLSILALPFLAYALSGWLKLPSTTIKKSQWIYGIVLFLIGTFWIQEPAAIATRTTTTVSYGQTASGEKAELSYVDTGFWIALLGWLWIIAGLTGKMTPEATRLVGVKHTKIRI